MTDDFIFQEKNMDKKTNLSIGIITALIFTLLFNISSFAYQCENVRNNTIRLHIIAASDSIKDQTIKLKVRDELLRKSESVFEGCITTENAKEKLNPKLSEIKNIADKILKENNVLYDSEVSLETEYFDSRIYENGITMPAGKYLALKISLGPSKGENWWCIMFPSLCLPAATENYHNQIQSVYSDKEQKIVMTTDKYKISFKIIEYIESLKNEVDNIAIR